MSGHTNGPWRVEKLTLLANGEGEDLRIFGLDGVIIVGGCGCCGSPWMLGPAEANARLIAAAPELLEALERLLPAEWSGLSDEGQPHNRTLLHSIDAIEAGYAAIAKARGTT